MIWYDMIWYDDMMIWWYDDMMIWWYDDMMIWWYDMIWYDMIWYDMMIWWYDDMMIWWYDDMMIWYDDMIWYDMIWYDMIWYDMIWSIWYETTLADFQGASHLQIYNYLLKMLKVQWNYASLRWTGIFVFKSWRHRCVFSLRFQLYEALKPERCGSELDFRWLH